MARAAVPTLEPAARPRRRVVRRGALELEDTTPAPAPRETPPEPGPRRRRGGEAEAQPGGTGGHGPSRARRGWFIAEEPDFRGRGTWLLMVFAALAMAVSWRLVDLQVRQAPQLAQAAAGQHLLTVPEYAHRGRILDRQGRLIASNLQTYSVFADPGVIPPEERQAVARALAPVLTIGPARLEEMLDTPGRFVYLAHGVDQATRQKLADLSIYGIGAINDDQRTYESSAVPGLSFASNLVGYVDHDGHGQYGVEAYYDAVLRGVNGKSSTLRDLAGNPIVLSKAGGAPARDGRDLRLGLDSRIQYYAEQAIAQGVVQDQAESGSLLVMDTKSGSIRAWADYPSFDANHYASADPATIKDNAVQGLYEPGSVMKVVTFAGALNKGVITPQTTLNEHVQTIDGFTIHDWDGRASHGTISMQYVLDDSLNNGAIDVMRRVGQDDFYRNLLAFGIGAPTGVDVAGEQSQPLRPQSEWSDVDYATASFGQQVTVTPIEMLAAVNAIGNGGVWVQPHAVDAITDSDGTQTAIAPMARRVMTPEAAATLEHMMTGVVEDPIGSGFAARIPAFKGQLAAKTGTASVPVNGHYGKDTIASFAGFAPLDNPQFTMIVIIRKPQNCTFNGHRVTCEGAYLAAPIWKHMTQLLIDDWKIQP